MGIPAAWHRRQALMLASQLPEKTEDARMVLQALEELLETFLIREGEDSTPRAANVLPFAAS
jgi:hypothetical protein